MQVVGSRHRVKLSWTPEQRVTFSHFTYTSADVNVLALKSPAIEGSFSFAISHSLMVHGVSLQISEYVQLQHKYAEISMYLVMIIIQRRRILVHHLLSHLDRVLSFRLRLLLFVCLHVFVFGLFFWMFVPQFQDLSIAGSTLIDLDDARSVSIRDECWDI